MTSIFDLVNELICTIQFNKVKKLHKNKLKKIRLV